MRDLTPLLPLLLAIGCGPDYPPVGQSWAVDTTSANWVEPEGADALAEVFASMYPFYLGLHEIEGDQATFLMVIGDGDDQDFCSRTVQMNTVTIQKDLSFTYGPADFTVANGFTTESLNFSGQISEDFATISDINFTGNLNLGTGPEDMFAMEGFDMTTCELVEVFNLRCGPCADGSTECLQAQVTEATAEVVPELSLIEIEKPDCHAQCDTSPENEDCDL